MLTPSGDMRPKIPTVPAAFKNPFPNPANRPQQFRHLSSIENPIIKHWIYDRPFSPTESRTLDHLGNLGLARRDCGLVAVEIRTSREG